MGRTGFLPEWVVPTVRAVMDCHWLAHAGAEEHGPRSGYARVLAVLEWVSDELPSRDQAVQMFMTADGSAYDTIVWLLGHRPPPIDLPRRNPDGSLMTVAQLIAEYMTDKHNGPEERRDADRWARREAIRSRHLASRVPD